MGASPLIIAFDLPAKEQAVRLLLDCSEPIRLSAKVKSPGSLLQRVEVTVPQKIDVYLALIGCLVKVNQWCLAQWPFPPLYYSGVVYVEEQLGKEVWQSIPALYLRRKGDCEDLVAARTSELRNHGYFAQPKLDLLKGRSSSGGRLFHFVIDCGDGLTEDPSKILMR